MLAQRLSAHFIGITADAPDCPLSAVTITTTTWS